MSRNEEEIRSARLVREDIFVGTNYSAKDILNYIVLFCEEFGIEEMVYFEVR